MSTTTAPQLTPVSLRHVVVVMLGFFALCLSWIITLPPFAGPDEPSNFVKAAALIRGDWVGEPIAADPMHSFWSTYPDIDERFGTSQQAPWCFVGKPEAPACDNPMEALPVVEPTRTQMGRYPPLGFLPASLGTLIGATDRGASAARTTSALACCGLLAAAALLLQRRSRSLTPLLIAMSPGVIFMASVDSPSGVEITAAVLAWCAVWCATAEGWSRTSTTAAFAVGAGVLVLARPAGIVAVIVMLVASAMISHTALLHGLIRHWKYLLGFAGAVLLSAAWYVGVYDDNFGITFDYEYRVAKFFTIASRTLADLAVVKIGESIGNYGWLDTPSPQPVIWFFVAATAVLAWRTTSTSTLRTRLALGIVVISVPAWAIALNVNYQDLLGTFGVQGRHLTPFLVGIPLIAVMHHTPRRSDRAVLTIAIALHAWCVMVALRRYSFGRVTDDWLGFLHSPVWTPPLGMTTSIALVALLHVAAWFALRQSAGRIEG